MFRKMMKRGYRDHPLDFYIVSSDLDEEKFVEAGFLAGHSLVQAAFVFHLVMQYSMSDGQSVNLNLSQN